jgi:multidrug transporter EmrE-like cation transporter
MIFLKEKVNIYGFIGVILIVLGVICLAFNEKKHKELFVTWDISV